MSHSQGTFFVFYWPCSFYINASGLQSAIFLLTSFANQCIWSPSVKELAKYNLWTSLKFLTCCYCNRNQQVLALLRYHKLCSEGFDTCNILLTISVQGGQPLIFVADLCYRVVHITPKIPFTCISDARWTPTLSQMGLNHYRTICAQKLWKSDRVNGILDYCIKDWTQLCHKPITPIRDSKPDRTYLNTVSHMVLYYTFKNNLDTICYSKNQLGRS